MWPARTASLIVAVVSVCGCKGSSEMPLKEGRSWTYSVRTNFLTRVEQIRVVREMSVGGVRGYELGGPLGIARLAWKGDTLISEQLANARLDPPLPLLVSGDDNATRRWSGVLQSASGTEKASAELRQKREKLTMGSRTIETIRAEIVLKTKNSELKLVSNYLPGFGLIKQTHHTNGSFDLELTALGGY